MASNIIAINRGDTYEFDITINDETAEDGRYLLTGNDAVYVGVMDPHQPFEEALIKKKIVADDADEEGNITTVIEPEDTIDLFPGTYYYMIKLKIDHEDEETGDQIEKVKTIINKTKFIIYD